MPTPTAFRSLRILSALCALFGVSVATPASAQFFGPSGGSDINSSLNSAQSTVGAINGLMSQLGLGGGMGGGLGALLGGGGGGFGGGMGGGMGGGFNPAANYGSFNPAANFNFNGNGNGYAPNGIQIPQMPPASNIQTGFNAGYGGMNNGAAAGIPAGATQVNVNGQVLYAVPRGGCTFDFYYPNGQYLGSGCAR